MSRTKRLVSIIAMVTLATTLAACSGNSQQSSSSSVSSESSAVSSSASSLSSDSTAEISFVGQKVTGKSDEYFDTAFTIQNDTDDLINTVTIDINELDENGDIISTTHPQESTIVQPGQKLSISGIHEVGVDSVQVVQYSFYVGGDTSGEYVRGTFKDAEPMKLEYSEPEKSGESTEAESTEPSEEASEPEPEPESGASSDKTSSAPATAYTPPVTSSNTKVTDEDMQGILLANAQAVVKDHLKSPSSAKFPWSFAEYKFIDKGTSSKHADYHTYYIEGPVEAENAYGTTIRGSFQVEIDFYKNSDNYYEVSCNIVE